MSNAAIEQERVARLRREQDEDDDRNRAVRAAQKGHDTEPPPVDGAYLASALTDAIGEGRGEHEQGCGCCACLAPLIDADPPVDEDAAAEARAYERGLREGRARAISEAVRYLRSIEHHASALLVWQHEVEQQTTKRVEESTKKGAASS